jgi:catechol 2,3-dioxygenase
MPRAPGRRDTARMSSHAHPAVRVGHVHLRVADLDRSIAFYRDALGFRVVVDGRTAGVDVVFLAAGDYHHHIALNTFDSAGGRPAPRGHTGLYHVAFLFPNRRELVRTVRRVIRLGYQVGHATDHGGTVAVYLDDPDGNGVELYYDRPRETWFDADGRPVVRFDRIEVEDLISETTRP